MVEAEAEAEEATESPKIRCSVGKAIASVKQFVTGSQGPSIPKDGAPSFISSPNQINRAEVVITVRQKKAVPEPIVVTSDTSSIPPDSQMALPSSSTPSFLSVQSSGSHKRQRDDQYEVYCLRHAFTASQEELALVRRQFKEYREDTDKYIHDLY